ncbi:helix-turn-helix transcriptional regulator [Roseateles violae]|uniref:AraC family transcriptional regulator n=1 Tax=Roseateles violae TaxID=3058042 RepID=A0ABT8DTN1_9BURK|nr:AraC family transcriptional regulator [Pelomonas sp. PFR6]MDN3921473.1 AraC family transcriptional regulator [Pelomonas sp. PFR6]
MRTLQAPSPASALPWLDQHIDDQQAFSEGRAAFDFDDPVFVQAEADGRAKRISRNGARFFFDAVGGSGITDVVRFAGGVEINVNNFVLPTLRRRHYIADETLILLRASLACDARFHVQGAPTMVFDHPELTLICLPRGVKLTVDGQPGVRQQGVNGIFRLGAFADVYGLQAADLPPVLRAAMEGSGTPGRVVSVPLSHRVAGLVTDTIDTPLEGEARALQYAGRLSELVGFALDALQRSDSSKQPSVLDWRDVNLAQLALERLSQDYRRPPRFTDLARELGCNVNKLQAAFKRAFGVTMAEYCLERRMREAQRLLLEGKLSVAEVGERVGYAHQSNFAAAFSAAIGMPPRAYKRHRAPIDIELDAATAPRQAR